MKNYKYLIAIYLAFTLLAHAEISFFAVVPLSSEIEANWQDASVIKGKKEVIENYHNRYLERKKNPKFVFNAGKDWKSKVIIIAENNTSNTLSSVQMCVNKNNPIHFKLGEKDYRFNNLEECITSLTKTLPENQSQ